MNKYYEMKLESMEEQEQEHDIQMREIKREIDEISKENEEMACVLRKIKDILGNFIYDKGN